MGDRDRRLRAVDDEEERGRREPPRHQQYPEDSLAGALQRLLGVVGFLGALFALGSWLEAVGLGRQFSTLATIAVFGTLNYWAYRRPDLVVIRAGTFGRIAGAINDSRQDIHRWTYRRPIRAGFLLYVGYGMVIVLLQEAVYALLRVITDWRLAVAVGALIGSTVIAPQLYRAVRDYIAQGTDGEYGSDQEEEWGEEEYEDDYYDEDER